MQLAIVIHPSRRVHASLAIHRGLDERVLQRFQTLARVGGQWYIARMSGHQRTGQRQGQKQ